MIINKEIEKKVALLEKEEEESQKIKEKESRYLNKCLAYRICPICGDDLKVKRGGLFSTRSYYKCSCGYKKAEEMYPGC